MLDFFDGLPLYVLHDDAERIDFADEATRWRRSTIKHQDIEAIGVTFHRPAVVTMSTSGTGSSRT